VGLAAGMDKNAAHIDALGSLGFGHIEAGTVTPQPQPGNPKPRLFRIVPAQALINRMGFNNDGVARFVANVRRQQRFRAAGGILGLNIGKNATTPIERAADDYVSALEAVYPHADYVTVNISSPNTKDLRALQGERELVALLRALAEQRHRLEDRHGRRVPLAVKIAPDLGEAELADIAAEVLANKVDGVIVSNTTIGRADLRGSAHRDEAGGLSGRPLFERSTVVLARMRRLLGPDVALIGVGGAEALDIAIEHHEVGAVVVDRVHDDGDGVRHLLPGAQEDLLADRLRDLISACDQIVMLGDRQRNTRHVSFLERITTD